MFNFSDAYIPITLDEIKLRVSDYDIFKKYCSNFEEIDRSFLSEFYNDTKASCRVLQSASGGLYYKDYGNGDYFHPFDYVKYKYSCNSMHEVLNIVANDFGLKKIRLNMDPKLLISNALEAERPKYVKKLTNINIVTKNFTLADFEYWNQYGIDFETLNKYNVHSCTHVFINKGNTHYVLEYSRANPIYAYEFKSGLYKIYMPLTIKPNPRWFSNVDSRTLQGFSQLPDTGDLLIITKALKDVMCYYTLGYNAVALQAESNKLDIEIFNELKCRFKKVICNFDNDDEGKNATKNMVENFNIDYFYIDEAKDLSDKIKNEGIEKVEQYLKQKI